MSIKPNDNSPFNELPQFKKSFYAGASDIFDHEYFGTNDKARYYHAVNARPTDFNESYLGLRKIKGEALVYENNNSGNYRCIGVCRVNQNIVEFWADKDETENSICVINGKIMINSDKFLIRHDKPLQIAVNENCEGGEIFITDYNIPPMYFNIGDIIENFIAGSQKYFSLFNQDIYTVNLDTPTDIPVFTGLEPVGGGGGLVTGKYVYYIRYTSLSGDKTALSVGTPMITVPVSYTETEEQKVYPYRLTYGGEPSVNRTSYGVKLKFRINNEYNYDALEVVRADWNEGAGIGFTPNLRIVKIIPVTPGQYSIFEFVDGLADSEENPITITDDEQFGVVSTLKKAKAVRYYNRRVVFGNVEYETKQMELQFEEFSSGNEVEPFTEDIGNDGLKNDIKGTYKQPFFNEEVYGFAIVGRDSFNNPTFAVPIEDAKSFLFPERRARMGTDSLSLSINPVRCSTVNGITDGVAETFECFSFQEPHSKTIGEQEGNVILNIMDSSENQRLRPDANDVGYIPNPPRFVGDNFSSYNIKHTTKLFESLSGTPVHDFNAKIFNSNYHSLGIAIKGISNIPKHIKTLSVVRTKRAGRVVCQGLGFYDLSSNKFGLAGVGDGFKSTNSFRFHSHDIENGIVSDAVIQDMKVNPGNYKIKLSAPLGMASEIFRFRERTEGTLTEGFDKSVDCIVYAKAYYESSDSDKQINPNFESTSIQEGNEDYINYGQWRNGNSNTNFPNASGGDTIFNLNLFSEINEEDGVVVYKLELVEDVYSSLGTTLEDRLIGLGGTESMYEDAEKKLFDEPVYIVTIIRDGVVIPDDNQTNYIDTGSYVKVESLVGISTGTQDEKHFIVDERIEDFYVEPSSSELKYIFIKDTNTNEEFRYLNVTNLNSVQRQDIINDIITLGFYTDANSNLVYGTYTATASYIEFGRDTTVPKQGDRIYIKYDKRFPIKVFGGDAKIGECFAPMFNRISDGNGGSGNEFFFTGGFPFSRIEMNPSIYVPVSSKGNGTNRIQAVVECRLGYYKQIIVNYIGQCFSAVHLQYGNSYCGINHILRPYNFEEEKTPSSQRVYQEYEDDYPGEELLWKLGGFRTKVCPINTDYSQDNTAKIYFSKPKAGFVEVTKYCNRVIWSLAREAGTKNSISTKTFKPLNFKDISDNFGDINYLYADLTDNGWNLYALCDREICLLLTDKRTISSLSGNELALIGEGTQFFITQEKWLVTGQGVPAEMWQSIAEYYSVDEFGNGLCFANNNSVFMFVNNRLIDMCEKFEYKDRLFNRLLKRLSLNDDNFITSLFETKYKEYYLQSTVVPITIFLSGEESIFNPDAYNHNEFIFIITDEREHSLTVIPPVVNTEFYFVNNSEPVIIEETETPVLLNLYDTEENVIYIEMSSQVLKVNYDEDREVKFEYEVLESMPELKSYLFVFSFTGKCFLGEYSYRADRYLSFDSKSYLMKNLQTYIIDTGSIINGQLITMELFDIINPKTLEIPGANIDIQSSEKEYVKYRIHSSSAPLSLNTLQEDMETVVSTNLGANMRSYGASEHYFNRDGSGNRIQGFSLRYKISDTNNKDFVLKTFKVKYKKLK